MTDRPIIFSGAMVRALLDGRKSQTRRTLKPQPDTLPNGFAGLRLPYAVGDRLWCREVWGLGVSDHGNCPRYRATMDYRCGDKIRSHHEGPFTWRSPIHMPRWASRLTLIVTDVRVQRVQSITEEDARAEGVCETAFWERAEHKVSAGAPWSVDRLAFADLWNSLHGPGAWDANPWVAALTFTTHHQNIDQMEPTND